MTIETDSAYLQRCARQERQMAEDALDPRGYRTHIERARGFERRLLALPDSAFASSSPDSPTNPKSAKPFR